MCTHWILVPSVVAALSAVAGPTEAQTVKWRAVSILEGGDSKNCGGTTYTKFEVEVTDGLVPALQRRGLVRTEYSKPTLRETLREF